MTTLTNRDAVLMARLERRLPHGVSIAAGLHELRQWLIECDMESGEDLDVIEEYVSDTTDGAILRWIQKRYDGGLASFDFSLCIPAVAI